MDHLSVSITNDPFQEEEGNKLPQNCPDWVKITEIPHPALVPNFISRRECLPDGSFDPNSPSVSLQMSLLQSSTLSPSLVSVISNIPSGFMCESIHKKNLREAKEQEVEGSAGFVITQPPSHYKRTSDPLLLPSVLNSSNSNSATSSVDAVAMANQTASELAALNILYGGVKGKAYLDSLRTFVEGVNFKSESSRGDGRIEKLLKDKLEKSESVCGFQIFKYQEDENNENSMMDNEIDPSQPLLEQNVQLLRLLNTRPALLNPETRLHLLNRLRNNLTELMLECPEEIRNEKFKGIIFEGI